MQPETNSEIMLSLDCSLWNHTPLTLDGGLWGHTPLTLEGFPASTEGIGSVMDGLARMETRTMLNETALAHELGVSTRTVRRLVTRNELPPGVKLGARRVWLAGDVLGHVQRRADRAARVAERTARRNEDYH